MPLPEGPAFPDGSQQGAVADLFAGESAFGVLADMLDELVATGVIDSRRRAAGVDIALWSAVHGFAVLCLDGPLAVVPRQAQEHLLTGVLDVAFHGLTG
jgi:hypothetical protein